nr:autotransporter outer membrane beta-barrel domain-containing protein [Veillonella sp.]
MGDTTDWYFGSVASVESPLVGATAKAHDGLYDLALDIDTLNKRFGEARYVRYEEEPRKEPHGIWARATHMNLGHDTYNGHANRYEIGRDYLMEREDGALVHRGGSFNYLRATTSYDGGSTKFKRYTGTLYHTWLGNKDHYLDLVGRVGKIHAKTKAYLVDGEQSKASFGTWYQQLSAEWGRRKALNEDWYFEPQVQLQYTHINSKTYTTNDGITNHLDHTNSLIGRLGFRLGHHIDEDTSWYFKADILHEFAGNRSFYLTSINGLERIHYDVTNYDTWYDIGLGINSEMSHNRSIWLEVERKFGGSYSKAWEINGGMTWRFD